MIIFNKHSFLKILSVYYTFALQFIYQCNIHNHNFFHQGKANNFRFQLVFPLLQKDFSDNFIILSLKESIGYNL